MPLRIGITVLNVLWFRNEVNKHQNIHRPLARERDLGWKIYTTQNSLGAKQGKYPICSCNSLFLLAKLPVKHSIQFFLAVSLSTVHTGGKNTCLIQGFSILHDTAEHLAKAGYVEQLYSRNSSTVVSNSVLL